MLADDEAAHDTVSHAAHDNIAPTHDTVSDAAQSLRAPRVAALDFAPSFNFQVDSGDGKYNTTALSAGPVFLLTIP